MNLPRGFVHIHRLDRGDRSHQTLGQLSVYDWDLTQVYNCVTLEPQWSSNRKDKNSCMPNGWYQLVKRWSERYNDHFEVQGVDYRSLMLLHVGNYRKNTKGCTLPGKDFTDIDDDDHKDVTSSGDVMKRLNKLLPHRIPILYSSEFMLKTT